MKETAQVEFKKSIGEWKEVVETASAFSNTDGGKIYVGVSNSGEVLGIKLGKNTIEELTNKIITNTDPKIYPKVSVEKMDTTSLPKAQCGPQTPPCPGAGVANVCRDWATEFDYSVF